LFCCSVAANAGLKTIGAVSKTAARSCFIKAP
jgi:hypothetical protein